MVGRLLATLAAIAVLAVLAIATWPQLLGLERTVVIAQVTALRGLIVAIGAALVILAVVIALASPRRRGAMAAFALVLAILVGVNVAVLAVRGTGGPAVPAAGSGEITVLSWNTYGGAPGADGIARLALDRGADVIALPETTEEDADAVAAILASAGRPMQVFTVALDHISPARSTSLLVSESLGAYRLDETAGTTPRIPSVVAVPVTGSGPTLVAAHPVAPIPDYIGDWHLGLDWVAARCEGTDTILAGDLNATLDHLEGLAPGPGELGRCTDAARTVGAAAVGTWPTLLPTLLGAPIDHVLTTPDWETVGFEVITSADDSGSDHRPVLAVVRPAA
ncbi:MAG: endonuclease/exonuclease/phosphatase family protein [Actinomycetales bacterium]|nr:endonuclease/exonuclease/phosphatase family protein [Actinomycetales bacterium]